MEDIFLGFCFCVRFILVLVNIEQFSWKLLEAREIAEVTIAFGFASDWLTGWHKFSGPITEQSLVKMSNLSLLSAPNGKLLCRSEIGLGYDLKLVWFIFPIVLFKITGKNWYSWVQSFKILSMFFSYRRGGHERILQWKRETQRHQVLLWENLWK